MPFNSAEIKLKVNLEIFLIFYKENQGTNSILYS